jgi:calcineurin-like phosphoesterase family protein
MLPGIYDAFKHWDNQTTWIYSDPHFSDKELEKSIIGRPSDEQQIANINSCVGRKDTLICLGDVGNIECVRRLRGRKILVMGNHDAGRTNYERKIISEVFDYEKYTKEQVREKMCVKYPSWDLHIIEGLAGWVATVDNKLFDEVYEGALIIGEKLILSHEPISMIPWAFNIHGHVHDKKAKSGPRHLNVCSDVIEYNPVNLNQFLKLGALAHIQTIHRETIDNATKRKVKRGGKKIGS